MTSDDDNDPEDNLLQHPHFDLTVEQRLTLVIERQNNVMRRVRSLEKKQEQINSLLNKGAGAIAVVTGVGIFIGWLFAISGNVWQWFHR